MRWLLPFWAACDAGIELTGPSGPEDSADPSVTDVPAPCDAGVCIGPRSPTATVGHHRVVVDDHGVAWVTWVESEQLRPVAMFLAASPASGAPLGALYQVPTEEPPVVGSSEKPAFDLRDGRLAIAHTGRGDLRHGDAHAIYVITGDLDQLRPRFGEPALIDLTSVERWVAEQVQVAITSDEVWLAYKRQIYGVRDIPTVARSSTGFEPVALSDSLSRDHECSPPHLLRTREEALLYALRSNIGGKLQTVILGGAGAGFGEPAQVSRSEWGYNADVCPPDGPRLAEHPDGTLLVVWAAPHDGALRVFRSWSTDRGATWSPPVFDHQPRGFSERFPTAIATTDTAGEWLSAISVDGDGAWLFRRDRVDADPTAERLAGPGGVDLEEVELASGGGRTVAVGWGDGRRWLVDL